MIDGQFDVIFRGQTIKNRPLEEVKANLVNLFKSSPEAVEKLFSGNEVAIKKSLDYSTAMKYQSALKNAGALALIKETEKPDIPQQSISQKTVESQRRATFGTSEPEKKEPVEANTTEKNPSKPTVATQVNQSQNIEEVANQADGNSMTLAAVGARILPNRVYEKREVDTSELSLANVGERILPKKSPENHPQPSIDHLKLEN